MNRLKLLLVLFVFSGFSALMAQTVTIKGTVTSSDDGLPIPSVAVTVKGTTIGTLTDNDGKYSINVPANATELTFNFVGMAPVTETINGRTTINVAMAMETKGLDEIVVTALGISRDKKSLGYAVQEVNGDNISKTRESNFVNSLSGKVAGLSVKPASTMGGSANILIRGVKSLLNNNQALFVVDGVPIDNSVANTATMVDGGGGYDYGNAASDINPDDIESMSVLKGAAASALYGSRAANGVIMITTKKGTVRKGIGVTVNAGVTFSKIDKSTCPQIQKEYGGGYGAYYDDPTGYFFYEDLTGDGVKDLIVPTSEDASWGGKFDKSLMVIDWVGLEPTDTKNYLRKVPWVAGKEDLRDFFETGVKQNYNVAFDGGTEKGTFRFSMTHSDETGILPNSNMKKNTANFAGSYKFTKKLTVETNVTYVNDETKGRYGTGYDPGNPMQSLGQWFQSNVNIADLREYQKTPDGRQRTWNYAGTGDLTAIYHNNIYWTRNMNYENDSRNRAFGYASLKYQLFPWLNIEGRASTDFYSQTQEERLAVYSNQTSQYEKVLRNFQETNLDFMAKFDKTFGILSVNGFIGGNLRRTGIYVTDGTTAGGLLVPELYTLMNSNSPVSIAENNNISGTNSVYASLSLGIKGMLFIDATDRYDWASTLPTDNRRYHYPSISTSFLVSELPALKDSRAISLLKVRLNYAEVGNDAPPYSTVNTYVQQANWSTLGVFSKSTTLANPGLMSEDTKSWEAGVEAKFYQNRFGLDFSVYKQNTYNQIMSVSISPSSGSDAQWVNSGNVQNLGFELALNATIVQTKDFSWDITANWFKNKNKVISLYSGVTNILLNSAWDVSTNATVGQPYGVLRGNDFVYTNGKRTVDADGYYLYSDATDAIIGNIQPDWNAGITSVFTYKGFALSALFDISHGGDVYSVDMKYGQATGLFKETAGLNAKGKPIRDAVEDGGGMIYPNTVYANGSKNTSYIWAGDWYSGWNYDYCPTKNSVYDASYVKLREVSFGYSLPAKMLAKTPIAKATISLVGRNLWLIHKNMPYYDPEQAMLSAGNVQGIADGAYPSTRTFGFNISLGF
jgi:TonB-linked SusC/RagA family outer membrane protein